MRRILGQIWFICHLDLGSQFRAKNKKKKFIDRGRQAGYVRHFYYSFFDETDGKSIQYKKTISKLKVIASLLNENGHKLKK